ncbi:MAG TPA: class I SAM-dependent methyltransferase [Candidatus Aquilonibacter sp.]|nr:class I SAM-dependent methyltransferase [Candidatus Aquilonibacter sp.]
MFKQSDSDKEFSKISPTAAIIAYGRSFSGAKFTQEIATLIHAKEVYNGTFQKSNHEVLLFSAAVEARTQGIDQAIRKEGVRQVIELAAGFSPRGMQFTADPTFTYVETDLEETIIQKSQIAQSILQSQKIFRPNLYFYVANALSLSHLRDAREPLGPQKLAVVSEGIFNYLTMDERRILSQNIKHTLNLYGGAWMLSDISTEEKRARKTSNSDNKKIRDITGRDTVSTAFQDDSHITSFFNALGFNVEKHEIFGDLNALKTLKRAEISLPEISSEVKEQSPWENTWVLRPY